MCEIELLQRAFPRFHPKIGNGGMIQRIDGGRSAQQSGDFEGIFDSLIDQRLKTGFVDEVHRDRVAEEAVYQDCEELVRLEIDDAEVVGLFEVRKNGVCKADGEDEPHIFGHEKVGRGEGARWIGLR